MGMTDVRRPSGRGMVVAVLLVAGVFAYAIYRDHRSQPDVDEMLDRAQRDLDRNMRETDRMLKDLKDHPPPEAR